MLIELPKPIADYVEANARLDVDGMLNPFTPDAVLLPMEAVTRATPGCGPCSRKR
jgi:ketosteroid isomerase-like protein